TLGGRRGEGKGGWGATAARGEHRADYRNLLPAGKVGTRREPLRLGSVEPSAAVSPGERAASVDQVFAGIKPLGNRPHRLAQRLAVAQICRTRENIDLSAGIVDVVLARRAEPGPARQRCKGVPNYGASTVSGSHGSGGIGGDEFYVDPLTSPDR